MSNVYVHDHQESPIDDAATVKDPVCGMTVDPRKTAHHAEHAGEAFHFRSAGCLATMRNIRQTCSSRSCST